MTDVHIGELHSTTDTVSPESLLSPQVIDAVVAAVRAALAADEAGTRDRSADLDTRSIVEQQRAGRR